MTRNQEVAGVLYEIAQLLEVQGVAFKPRAYQRAARAIESLGEDVEALAQADRLREVPGVGQAIDEKVKEFLSSGSLKYLEQLRSELPSGLTNLMRVPGIGPKSAVRLHQELKVSTLEELEKAAKGGRVRSLKGFGEKSEQEILAAIARVREQPQRVSYSEGFEVAEALRTVLARVPGVKAVEPAGSLRRGRDTVADVDLLVSAPASAGAAVLKAFTTFARVSQVVESGSTRAIVLLRNGLQVDLRVVAPESFGAALQYFTGSKEHNIALRTRALKKGWTINEYALSDKKTGERIAGTTEEEIYAKLGMAWIAPELRENQGEIDLAVKKDLPTLVTRGDLRGDLHTHTNQSDGLDPLEKLVAQAWRLGYSWFGVSDHAKGGGAVNGMEPKAFHRQRQAIEKLQKENPRVRILQGAEVDVLKDGTLTLPKPSLAELDYVIGSIHSHFNLDAKTQTNRILAAFDAGIDILGHPTTRKVGTRPEIEVQWDVIYQAAADKGILMEIDATPDRLDLMGEKVHRARELGCNFAINSDAHAAGSLEWIHYGVTQARRGWIGPERVVNTLDAAKLLKRLGHGKK